MKKRLGFVSNSSSSSFIIGFKKKPTREQLVEFMKVPKDSPIYFLAEDFADFFINEINRGSHAEKLDKKSLIEGYDYLFDEKDNLTDDEKIEKLKEDEQEIDGVSIDTILSSGWTFYTGCASDEGTDGIEQMICDMDLDIETEDLIIKKAGGY